MKRRLHLVSDKLCTKCGGRCCKTLPGAAEPKDFGAPNKKILIARVSAALASSEWCFDWWEGDPRPGRRRERIERAYFMRPAVKGHVGERFHPAWKGECALLTKKGCSLEYGERPVGCRGLKPIPSFDCQPAYGDKREVAILWVPYLGALREAGLLDGAEHVHANMLGWLGLGS